MRGPQYSLHMEHFLYAFGGYLQTGSTRWAQFNRLKCSKITSDFNGRKSLDNWSEITPIKGGITYNPTYNRVIPVYLFHPYIKHMEKKVACPFHPTSKLHGVFETHRGDVYTRHAVTSPRQKLHNSRPGDHGDVWGFYSFKAPTWGPPRNSRLVKGSWTTMIYNDPLLRPYFQREIRGGTLRSPHFFVENQSLWWVPLPSRMDER